MKSHTHERGSRSKAGDQRLWMRRPADLTAWLGSERWMLDSTSSNAGFMLALQNPRTSVTRTEKGKAIASDAQDDSCAAQGFKVNPSSTSDRQKVVDRADFIHCDENYRCYSIALPDWSSSLNTNADAVRPDSMSNLYD